MMLAIGGYEAGVERQGASAVLVITLIPALITLLLAGAVWRFRLDDKRMDAIRQDLATRRGRDDASRRKPFQPDIWCRNRAERSHAAIPLRGRVVSDTVDENSFRTLD